MQVISQKQIQPMLLDILVAFREYCRQNSLEFFLSGGTLLGAIRHKGFIPWDDDIDVVLLAKDFDRLQKLAELNPYIDETSRYKILLPVEPPNFYPFIKIVDTYTLAYERNISREYATGLWVDVFRMTPCPEDEQELKKLFDEQQKWKKKNKVAILGNVKDPKYKWALPVARIAQFFGTLIGHDAYYYCNKIKDLWKECPENSSVVMNITWPAVWRDRFKADWYSQVIPVEFEDEEMPAPIGYHEYLEQFYGDYMRLPPEEDRVRHGFEAYYLK